MVRERGTGRGGGGSGSGTVKEDRKRLSGRCCRLFFLLRLSPSRNVGGGELLLLQPLLGLLRLSILLLLLQLLLQRRRGRHSSKGSRGKRLLCGGRHAHSESGFSHPSFLDAFFSSSLGSSIFFE